MEKPLVQLNKFFELAAEQKLSGSDQLVYLHLYNAFNRAHWTETLCLSDTQLQRLINLFDTNGKPASIDVVRRAKQRLKSKGFIDFKSGKGNGSTEYHLIKLFASDTPAYTPAHSAGYTPTQSEPSSIIHVREDLKDNKDNKTELTTTAANAGAKVINFQTGVNDLSENSPEVLEAWANCQNTKPLRGNYALAMIQLEREFGTEAVVKAIKAADFANKEANMSINFLKAVLLNQMKGGEKNGKVIAINAAKQYATSASQQPARNATAEDWELADPAWLD